MNLFIIEDDITTIKILEKVINECQLGNVVGYEMNGDFNLNKLSNRNVDIVLLDLLMPKKDGIKVAKDIKELFPLIKIIMISQVSGKDMIGRAYKNGIEYYIHKPINALELEQIVKKVSQIIKKDRILGEIQNIFNVDDNKKEYKKESLNNQINIILKKIGVIGEIGSEDIVEIVSYLINNNENISKYTVKELCSIFEGNPRNKEQRIRRTINIGLVNLAHIGIEDYLNESFQEYSNTLYNFEQIKREMDFIRGRSKDHGKVNFKKFINGLIYYCEKNMLEK